MKKSKLITFLVHGKAVEQIDGSDLGIDEAEMLKVNIAFVHGVAFDEVVIDMKDIIIPEISATCAISNTVKGELLFKTNSVYSSWRVVSGIRPAMDISHEDLFYEFLDLIQRKDFDNAIIFN